MVFFNNSIVYAGMILATFLLQLFWVNNSEIATENARRNKRQLLTDVFFCICIGLSVATLFRLFPGNHRRPGDDSSVFLYIAERMKEGKIPYLDMFDHKGPILYWIEYLGLLIPGKNYFGIWIIEAINMIITVALMCKLGGTITQRKSSIFLAVLVCAGAIGWKIWQGGNFTEEYALPWIILATCVFFSFFQNGSFRREQIMLLGSSFTIVFLLRANMVAEWVALIPVTVVLLLKKRRYQDIGKCLLYFLTGVVIVLIPVLCYALHTSCLQEMYRDYFVFNMAYTDNSASDGSTLSLMLYFAKVVWPGTAALVLSLVIDRSNRICWYNALCFLASLYTVTMSGRGYFHYAIVLLPTLIIPLTTVFDKTEALLRRRMSSDTVCSQTVILASAVLILTGALLFRVVSPGEETSDPVVEFIQEHTEKDDDVLILGKSCWYYLLSDRKTENRYFYQLPPAQISNEIYEDFLNELARHPSTLIVFPGSLDERERFNTLLHDIRGHLLDLSYCNVVLDGFEVFLQK